MGVIELGAVGTVDRDVCHLEDLLDQRAGALIGALCGYVPAHGRDSWSGWVQSFIYKVLNQIEKKLNELSFSK